MKLNSGNRRNARERNRIRTVNGAFDVLRDHVPSGRQSGKKISKVETLKSAIEYIHALQGIIENQKALMGEDEEGEGKTTEKQEYPQFSKNELKPENSQIQSNNPEIEIFTSNIEFEKTQTNKNQEETDFYKTTGIQPSDCFLPNYSNNLPNNKF